MERPVKITTWSVALLVGCYVCGARVAEAQIWTSIPALAGGTSAPSEHMSGVPMAYSIYGFDRDSSSGSQWFDTTIFISYQQINTPLSPKTITHQGDDVPNGKRNWDVSGTTPPHGQNTIYYDHFKYDDNPSDPDRNDDQSGQYTKVVTLKKNPP